MKKTCGLLSQSSPPAQPILGQGANFAHPFKNEHQLTSPGCAQIFLLFSYFTCSVQNLKTAVRTASAPENAFKVKDRFATCVERNAKQCKTWQLPWSRAMPCWRAEGQRFPPGRIRATRPRSVRSGRHWNTYFRSNFARIDFLQKLFCPDSISISHLPGVIVPLTGQRLDEERGLPTNHVQDVLVGQRQLSPGFSQYTPPSPFCLKSFCESLVTCGAPRCNGLSL